MGDAVRGAEDRSVTVVWWMLDVRDDAPIDVENS